MANTGNSVKVEEIREVAFGDITSSYVALGDPLGHDAFRITFINTTDVDVYFSIDGMTNQRRAAAMSARVMDDKTDDMYTKKNTQFYVKYAGVSDPTVGSFWIEVEYV